MMIGIIEFDGPLTSDVLMFQDLIGLSFQDSTFLKILTGLWILEIVFFCMEALSKPHVTQENRPEKHGSPTIEYLGVHGFCA